MSTLLAPPLHALFRSWIDFAGPFPPASLAIPKAVDDYLHFAESPDSWLLHRLVIRLEDVPAADRYLATVDPFPTRPVPLSVVVGSNWHDWPQRLRRMERDVSHCRIEAIEGRWQSDAAPIWSSLAADRFDLFVEVAAEDDLRLEECLSTLSRAGVAAKLRTGGTRPDQFPSVETVVGFLAVCRKLELPYKLTAGLHHALPGEYPLTYEPRAELGKMHGFFGVALAALLLETDPTLEAEATEAMQSNRLEHLAIDESAITWKHYRWSSADCALLREKRLRSVGSCSFTEPLDELQSRMSRHGLDS